ncbi:MAG: LptF/LptG family permease [Firmicutes bacterium]|nr:LptF/LptG family permease [Bacillota bacterium]
MAVVQERRRGHLLLIDRYVLREFLLPFLGCAAGFSLILVSGLLFELTDLILVKRVEWQVVVRMLFYRLPDLVVTSLPVGALFGVLLALGRLARDNELTVIRAAGVSFSRIARWLILACLGISLAAYGLNERVVPWANHQYQTLLRKAIFKDPVPAVQEQVFFRDGDGNVFYVRRVDTARSSLEDVMIYQPGGAFPRMITARSGLYTDRVWHLEDVVTREIGDDGFVQREVRAERLNFPMTDDTATFFGEQRTTDEMTRAELAEHIRLFQQSGIDVRAFVVDYHMKLALPLASLVLALLAAPFSLWGGRHGWVFGLGASVALAFVYYTVNALFRSLGANGALPPFLAAWLGNWMFAAVGVWLFFRADRAGGPFR